MEWQPTSMGLALVLTHATILHQSQKGHGDSVQCNAPTAMAFVPAT